MPTDKTAEIRAMIADLDKNRNELTERLKEAHREERRKANEEARKRTEELRARLEREYGVAEHPKASLLWSKAWERGHSCGFEEVENVYSDLVELIQ